MPRYDKRFAIGFLLLGSATACGTLTTQPAPQALELSLPSSPDEPRDEEAPDPSEIAAIDAIERIPVEMNPSVEKWIRYFTVTDRERFQRFLDRGHRYREVVETHLEENGLPRELYYLAMIESGYQVSATSSAKAAGVWQFMSATGTRYGLRVDRHVDERRDPIQATEAATKYLKDLYNVFGSWYLAMAAYNAGENRIIRAVLQAKTRDFWILTRSGALPRETAEYVPKFLAAVTVGQNIAQYEFQEPAVDKYPDLQAVAVPGGVAIENVAQLAGVSADELKRLNPHLRRGITPPGRDDYEIWVPTTIAASLEGSREKLLANRAKASFADRAIASRDGSARPSRRYYRVKTGDTLTSVAREFRITVPLLKRINGMASDRLTAGQTLRISSKTYRSPSSIKHYRVRRGDSLTTVARKFSLSIENLKSANALRGNRIYVGQILRIENRGR